MKHARLITEEQEKKIVELYRAGSTQISLASEFGLSVSGIQNVIRRNGAAASQRGRRASVDVEQMKKMYASGMSLQQIGDELGVHNTSVWGHLRRAGVTCRPAGFQKGEQHPGWVGGRIINSSGYVMIRVYPGDPFFSMAVTKTDGAFYVMEHRYVMAQELGRPLDDNETVHHKDGDKQNNDHLNLQLRVGRHGKGAAFCCADCGSRNIVSVAIVEPS